MGSRHIKDINDKDYLIGTGGWVAAKGRDAYAHDPERFLGAMKLTPPPLEPPPDPLYDYEEVIEVANNLSLSHSAGGCMADFQKAFDTLVTESGDNWWLLSKAIDAEYGTNFFNGIKKIEDMLQKLEAQTQDLGVRLGEFAEENLRGI